MKIISYTGKGQSERLVVTGMIVSKDVLRVIAPVWDPKKQMLRSKWADLVGGWCVKYYQKYDKPPGAKILVMLDRWLQDKRDKETAAQVQEYLKGLDREYTAEVDVKFTLDTASDLFTRTQQDRLIDLLQKEKDRPNSSAADFNKVLADNSVRINLNDTHGSAIDDFEGMVQAFEAKPESIVKYPGAAGEFFGDDLCRSGFVAFLAPEKRGKCVHEDAQVVLANGEIRTVRQLVEGRGFVKVLSLSESGKFVAKTVTRFWDNGVKPVYRITTRTGRQIEVTNTHKVLTPTGWKPLEEVAVTDRIGVPKNLPVFGQISVPSDELRYAAYMLAEGGCSACFHQGRPHGSNCNWTNQDPETVKDFLSVCTRLGISWRQVGISYRLKGEACRRLTRKYGMDKKLAKEKEIPQQVFTAPKDQVAEFLRVFFTCDGSVYKNNNKWTVEVGLASEKLVRQIAHLLLRFGIVGRLTHSPVTNSHGQVFQAWRYQIRSEEYVQKFLKEVNFDSYKRKEWTNEVCRKSFLDTVPWECLKQAYDTIKQEGRGAISRAFGKKLGAVREILRLKAPAMRQTLWRISHPLIRRLVDSDILWDTVESVEHVGNKRTYDLTVPENHNFVADDVIVHNSTWLMDLCWRAMLQRRRVMFYSVGDLTMPQVRRRFAARACGRPIKPAKDIVVPKELVKEGKYWKALGVTKSYEGHLGPKDFKDKYDELRKYKLKSNDTFLRLWSYPSSSVRASDIKAQATLLMHQGWRPDVVVVDYADILAPENGAAETRDQINATWKTLNSIRQELDCLVVTATQANAASYTSDRLTMANFSEDKRKFAHVTAMIGINQTEAEKQDRIQRLNYIVRREDEFLSGRPLVCASNPKAFNPCVLSVWPSYSEDGESSGEENS